MWPQDLLAIHQFSSQQIKKLLSTAVMVKETPERWSNVLAGKQFALLFEKPSLRTRVSFAAGLSKLGAGVQYLDFQEEKLGQRETLKDMAKNMSRYLDGMIVRCDSHDVLKTIQHYSDVPIVNALCDLHHPCQALADMLTLQEKMGSYSSFNLAYFGEGNNVCHSLMEAVALLGGRLSVVTPEQEGPNEKVMKWCRKTAKNSGAKIEVYHNISDVKNIDVVYTDTWVSMGDEKSVEETLSIYSPFQVNTLLMERLGAQYFMHCQPIHRGMEVTADVADSSASIMYQQAENRMHVQNAFFIERFFGENNNKKIMGE